MAVALAYAERRIVWHDARDWLLRGSKIAGVVAVNWTAGHRRPSGCASPSSQAEGRAAVPTRSVLVGAALAVALVVATVTFGSGLQTLVSHPALYGWNWSYMLNPSNNVPPQALALLRHDPDVANWTGYDYDIVEIDGQNLPVLFQGDHPAHSQPPISPPILRRSRASRQRNQIVLGAATLAQLHKHIGDTVDGDLRQSEKRPHLRPSHPPRHRGHRHHAGRRDTPASSPITRPWGPGHWSP